MSTPRPSRMSARARAASMPVLAVVLVATVLGVQLAQGGGRFEPLRPADPCVAREVASRADGIEGLTERLVLLGVDGAACRLGVTREALTLQLAQSAAPSDEEVTALREGLQAGVRRMQDDGSLPAASELADEVLDSADLNGFVKALIRALPDAAIDAALKTDDVLSRAIADLDLRSLLANLTDQESLEQQVEATVTQAVKDSLLARLPSLG